MGEYRATVHFTMELFFLVCVSAAREAPQLSTCWATRLLAVAAVAEADTWRQGQAPIA